MSRVTIEIEGERGETRIDVERDDELTAVIEAVTIVLASRGSQIRAALQQVTSVLSDLIELREGT